MLTTHPTADTSQSLEWDLLGPDVSHPAAASGYCFWTRYILDPSDNRATVVFTWKEVVIGFTGGYNKVVG